MIEIIELAEPDKFKLIIDGVEYSAEQGMHIQRMTAEDGNSNEAQRFFIYTFNDESIQVLSSQRLSDLPKVIEQLQIGNRLRLFPSDIRTNVALIRDASGFFKLRLINIFEVENWKRPWSVAEYMAAAKLIVDQEKELGLRWDGDADIIFDTGFSLLTAVAEDMSSTIEGTALSYNDVVQRLHELTVDSLQAKLPRESVVMQFDFPEEVRVPCEQYLLYFAQFLRDLGVSADTALTHEAGQVLFTVTPEDKEQALDNIRAALEVYLHLPSSPVSDAGRDEIVILRLNSELQSLQSKLSLARAEIQMREVAIQLQKVTIAQLTGEVVVQSIKDVTPKPKDKEKEELLGDIVSLVPIKGKGFEVNLPELLRKLKQLFKKEE